MKKQENLYDLIDSIGNLGEVILVLSPLKTGILEKWVLKSCIYGQAGVSARLPDPDLLIDLSEILGLVEIQKNKKRVLISLSNLGNNLLKFRHIEKDRLTKQQGKFLLPIVIKKINILSDTLSLINIFNASPNGNLWISSSDKRIDALEDRVLRLFQQLRVAKYAEGNIIVEKDDKEWLISIVSSKLNIDIDNLLNLIDLEKRCGILAEEFVLRMEKERLIKSGRQDLAKLVRRISDQNIAAGYDILSFDGAKSHFSPDRFIEVKGTSNNQVLFYISKNEIEMARRMQGKYWIYCVLNVGSAKSKKLRMIKNAYKSIFQTRDFKVQPVLWRVCTKNRIN